MANSSRLCFLCKEEFRQRNKSYGRMRLNKTLRQPDTTVTDVLSDVFGVTFEDVNCKENFLCTTCYQKVSLLFIHDRQAKITYKQLLERKHEDSIVSRKEKEFQRLQGIQNPPQKRATHTKSAQNEKYTKYDRFMLQVQN